MATKKNYFCLGSEKVNPVTTDFEFDESDVWNSTDQVASNEPKRSIFVARAPKRSVRRNDHDINDPKAGRASTSLPVNVPDWSKILGGEYKSRRRTEKDGDDDDGDDGRNEMIPPHEYLARTRIASSSVHEGIGRTLKGRDMRKVRNAVWKQIGFED